MDRGVWRVTVHGVTKSQTRMSAPTHTHSHTPLELPCLITGPVLWMSTFSIGVQGGESGKCESKWEKKSSWVEHLLNGLCSLKIIQGQKEGKSIF